MQVYEYKVVPAPNRGEKARGLKTSADRFAHALSNLMNELGRDGWEYVRSDTLPSEERSGFTKRTTVYHSVLVFRRSATKAEKDAPRKLLTAEAPEGKAPPVKVEPDMPAKKAETETAAKPEADGTPEIAEKG